MGQSSSSDNGVHRHTSISTKEYDIETSSHSQSEAHFMNDERQRLHVEMNTYNEENQPRSEGPSPYVTLRTNELQNQKPMASSLINVLPPKYGKLMYTAQSKGWQSADDHDSSYQQNNEITELSQITSQLAMANHQLASAHNTTLTRMEALYLELTKAKENQKRTASAEALETFDDGLWRRLRNANEANEREEIQRLEQRLLRLERLLGGSFAEQCEQRNLEENNKLRSKIVRLTSLTRNANDEDYSMRSAKTCQSSEQRTNRIMIDAVSEVPDNYGKDQHVTKEEEYIRRYCSAHSDNSEINVPMINRSTCSSIDLDKVCRKLTKLRNNEHNSMTDSSASEQIFKLTEEVEKLPDDQLEGQSANKEFFCSLADQKNLVEKLSENYEEMKARCTTAEANLSEYRRQYNELMKHLDIAKKEIETLLKEVDIFKTKKDTADTRISILEQNLQKSLLEKEQIKNVENQKASKLRAQLFEEISDKKKQIKALEDALQEIQRLKQTIKTEKKSDNNAWDVDISTADSLNDLPETTSDQDRTAASMEEFKKDLILKREARHKAMAAVSSEMERLKKELAAEKEAHSETSSMLALLRSAQSNSQNINFADNTSVNPTIKKQNKQEQWNEYERTLKCVEAKRLTSTLKVSDELRSDIRYQIEQMDDLRYQLEINPEYHQHRIHCLTEVTNKARQSSIAREHRTNELKDYLAQILVRLGDRNFLEVQDDEGAECNRQLENISTLKSLYNGRLKVLTELKDSATKELTDIKQKLDYSLKKSENLEEELKKAEEKIDAQDTEITNLESQLGLTKADCRDLQNQMSLINGLFTQMLLGASSADMDLDRLTQLLQENHDLISDIAREESTEAAALPKLLLDLIKQVEDGKTTQNHTSDEKSVENIDEVDRKEDDLQEEDIAHNLPKVWRVLLELLSCHAVTSPSVSVASCSDPNSCYKSVDTPTGPRLVISVSKTYIRLKELILEKKHVEKEMNRMKQLNIHLESKLSEQEKRLSMVSTELTKTWSIVGRMQAQHQQLHTHEEILRYELQQKRKMLQELKQELEYCREKWESARQKNTNTELEWRNLRREFAARKALTVHDSFNSAESGFSDERGDDTDEEEEPIEERIRYGPRRRTRKENARASTPDTESEQPTDTELSESKTGSSIILEQRTPTPETETELDDTEVTHVDLADINITESDHIEQSTQETLNSLDKALTNVIQNLIRIEDTESDQNIAALQENTISFFEDPCEDQILEPCENERDTNTTILKMNFNYRDPQSSAAIPESCDSSTAKTLNRSITNIDQVSNENTSSNVSQPITTTASTVNTTPIFSIGPFPIVLSPSIKSVQFSNPLIVGPSNRPIAPMFGTAELENSADNSDIFSSLVSSSSNDKEEPTKNREQRLFKPTENVVDSDSISVDSFSSLETVREFPMTNLSLAPSSTSTSKKELQEKDKDLQKQTTIAKPRLPEEVLAARADRLKRLEEQADWLVKKMNATSKRGIAFCTRLEELHETYGEPPVPPPMPDVLPSCRLPSSLDLPCQVSNASSTDSTETKNFNASKDNTSENTP